MLFVWYVGCVLCVWGWRVRERDGERESGVLFVCCGMWHVYVCAVYVLFVWYVVSGVVCVMFHARFLFCSLDL